MTPFCCRLPVAIPAPPEKCSLVSKRLSTRKPAFCSKAVAELADLLGLAWDDRLTAAVDHADDALQSDRPAPLAAAELIGVVHALRPDAESALTIGDNAAGS